MLFCIFSLANNQYNYICCSEPQPMTDGDGVSHNMKPSEATELQTSDKQEVNCDICYKPFRTLRGLNAHRKSHPKIPKPMFACYLCRISFFTESDLTHTTPRCIKVHSLIPVRCASRDLRKLAPGIGTSESHTSAESVTNATSASRASSDLLTSMPMWRSSIRSHSKESTDRETHYISNSHFVFRVVCMLFCARLQL